MSTLADVTHSLRAAGITFKLSLNNKAVIVDPKGKRLLYYISTGRFYPRDKNLHPPTTELQGVDDLIRYVRGD